MRRFNMSVAKLKNANGEYVSIPALRDRSGYETAKANGYTGTEEEWLNDIYSDGWIAAVQALEQTKADKAEFDKFMSDTNDEIDGRIPPWNLNQNIGNICSGTKGTVIVENGTAGSTLRSGHAIPIISGGKIRVKGNVLIKWISTKAYTCDPSNTFAKIYVNEVPVYEVYAPETKLDSNTLVSEDFSCDVDVKKGDTLSFIVSASNTYTNYNYILTSTMSDIEICANIETPFRYTDIMEELENPSTTTILNKLLP